MEDTWVTHDLTDVEYHIRASFNDGDILVVNHDTAGILPGDAVVLRPEFPVRLWELDENGEVYWPHDYPHYRVEIPEYEDSHTLVLKHFPRTWVNRLPSLGE